MIAYSGLISLSLICNAAGFAPVPVPTAKRSGSSGTCILSRQALGDRHGAAWRTVVGQQTIVPRVRTLMTADGGEGETEPAAPRLKRVRKRRKDAGSVATAEDEEEGGENAEVSTSFAVDAVAPTPPPVERIEPARGAVVAAEDVDVVPQVVAAQQAVADIPGSVGGTKGTKVRVDNSDDELAEKLSDVASVASGAAGEAASVVSGAAKSAFGAAMSVLGQGGEASTDDFDLDNMPSPGTSRMTTPGKSANELADLGADIERFRSLENKQPVGMGESFALGAKDLISTVITVDFFVVIAFMLWFIAGVVSSYGFNNTFLLDEFNDKWTPVVQPALGVLMGGTIAGGVVSKLGESGDEDDTKR